MTGHRDTRPANWKKTVRRLRRNMEELREFGITGMTEPDDFDTPPHLRPQRSLLRVVESESFGIPPHRRIAKPSTV